MKRENKEIVKSQGNRQQLMFRQRVKELGIDTQNRIESQPEKNKKIFSYEGRKILQKKTIKDGVTNEAKDKICR